jgi:hypothetical protein
VKQHDHGTNFLVRMNYGDIGLKMTDDITTATPVKFTMRLLGTSPPATPAVDKQPAAVASVDTTTIPPTITCRYVWQSNDLALAGKFRGEFEFTLAGGAVVTGPSSGYLLIVVDPDLS